MAFTHVLDGTHPHRHVTVEQARQCEYFTEEARDEYDADAAFERHLETRDWAEQAAFEDYERRMGKVSFEDAYAAAMGVPA
jgi:hypothetical protein